MADSSVGGKREMRIMERALGEHSRAERRLRAALYSDGFPPGGVPTRDPEVQRMRLEEVVAGGGVLSPEEGRRLAELRGS